MQTRSHPWTLLRYSEVTNSKGQRRSANIRRGWETEVNWRKSYFAGWHGGLDKRTQQVQVIGKECLISWQHSVSRPCKVSTGCLLSVRRPLTWEAEAATNTLSLPRRRGGFNPSDGSGSGIGGGDLWMKEQQSCQLWQWRKQFVQKMYFSIHTTGTCLSLPSHVAEVCSFIYLFIYFFI